MMPRTKLAVMCYMPRTWFELYSYPMRAHTKDDYRVILGIRVIPEGQQFYDVEPSLAQPRKELG